MRLGLSSDEFMLGAFIFVTVLVIGGVIFAFTGSNSGGPETVETGSSLHLEPVQSWEEFEGSVADFEDLSSEQQQVFEQALSQDSLTATIDDPSFWSGTDAVNYEGATYRATVE